MKRKLMLLILLFCGFVCLSQNRVNDPLPIISKNVGQLVTAQGWFKNSFGQWLGRKNKIISELGNSTKILENYEKYSVGQDNFILFERKNVVIEGDTCALLIKKYRDGYYKYESIEEDWVAFNSIKFYVLSMNDIAKIESVNHNSISTLIFNVLYTADIKYIDLKTYSNTSLANEINKAINKKRSYDYHYQLGLNINCLDDKKLVQFYFFDSFPGLEAPSFDKYYETSFESFSNLINIY